MWKEICAAAVLVTLVTIVAASCSEEESPETTIAGPTTAATAAVPSGTVPSGTVPYRLGETVAWAGPSEGVTASFVTQESCPITSELGEGDGLPTSIVFEDGKVYWLSGTTDWTPAQIVTEAPSDTGYRLGPLALFFSPGFGGPDALYVVDSGQPLYSYAYVVFGCK